MDHGRVSDEGAQRSISELSPSELNDYIVSHVEQAIESGWVVPYFQPVVRTLTGKLCGAEALARWEDPIYGVLQPDAFIPPLEEARLIHLLDSCIVQQVCRHYRDCVDAGIDMVPASFNLSRLDFDLCDIFNVVEEAVHKYEVPRDMLNIEITETILGTDPIYMTGKMRQFHDVGYKVWMDDFGSGYSTLNVLKDFDFDELKMDMEFLNRFGEKSKTILASVVDMAKKLGIQTLAEGVETEEHRRYLRRIGCEKMQGYLFGRPTRFDREEYQHVCKSLGLETRAERLYMDSLGLVNTLSLSERDFSADNITHDYVTSMPLAMVEFDGEKFRVIDSNRVFREGLANVGILSIADAEERINDMNRPLARTSRKLVETIAEDKFARQDYITGDIACVMRIRHITSQGGRVAVLVSIDDTIEQSERRRHNRMNASLAVLGSIYEQLDVIHLDDGYAEPVFSGSGFKEVYDLPSIEDSVRQFAKNEIFPDDRKRYCAYLDPSTIMDRIHASGANYLVDFFRTRDFGGDYVWKLFTLIEVPDVADNQVLLCVRNTHWANDGLLQDAYGGHREEGRENEQLMGAHAAAVGLKDADMRLTDGSLWRTIIRDDSMGIFWKDRNRRFIGANQAFLDYYGFDSIDAVLGKTDEDMGWHIDPVPFKEDELRVLNEGECTSNVMGQCIVRGEVRSIVATKRPVYRNGRIVGLVGYFMDVADRVHDEEDMAVLPMRDNVTGLLNYTGLESATWQFVDSYVKLGKDFAMVSINLESFRRINDELGYAFGEKVLKCVADKLRELAGARCAIGHVYAERFVVLVQEEPDEVLQKLCQDVEESLASISEIDGTPCTVYALASFSRYSDLRDIDAMKRRNRDERLARSDEWAHGANESDVVTSTFM